jgi:putative PIN family toxin of toxin-antitoxin system
MALEGEIELAVSDSIIRETLGILRDKFKRTEQELRADESNIRTCAKLVEPSETLSAVPRDPDDNHVLECAVAARSEIIVSGDRHLLEMETFGGIEIMKVSDFLKRVGRSG